MKKVIIFFYLLVASSTIFAQIYYHYEKFGHYTVIISGEYSYTLRSSELNITIITGNKTFTKTIDANDAIGYVKKMKVTDFDQDGLLEVLVVTSSGNGGYGDISFLEFNGQSFKSYSLPGLVTYYVNGYRGRDTFSIKNNRLVRSFPLYNGKVFNVQTGTFYVYYTFTCNNEWAISGIKHVEQENDTY